MNKKIISCLLFLGALSTQAMSETNNVEQLIAAHNEACGGENTLWNLQSISRSGYITFYNQNPKKPIDRYDYNTYLTYPLKLREQLNGDSLLVDRGTDGISFWAWNGNQYTYVEQESLINSMKETAEQANRDLLFIQRKVKDLTYLSRTPDWAPSQSQCIQGIKMQDNKPVTYCFNNKTHLLNAKGDAAEYRLFQNYRLVGTILLPFHLIHYKNGLMAYEVQLHHALLDAPISDDKFNFPS